MHEVLNEVYEFKLQLYKISHPIEIKSLKISYFVTNVSGTKRAKKVLNQNSNFSSENTSFLAWR